MSRRRAVVAAAVLVGTALVAGCASIPSGGVVHSVEGDQTPEQNAVRFNPPGPASDASPTQIVYGYLDAMLAYPVRTDVAQSFLTDDAAQSWRPGRRTFVYSQPRVAVRGGAGDKSRAVHLTYTKVASLDATGSYTDEGEKDTTVTWRLVKEDGQWRISNPPRGRLISEKYFEDYYLPLNLYYFDRTASRLVADPVYQLEGEQLATSLTTALLRGAGDLLAGQARSYLPDETRLDAPVSVDEEGVARVELTGPVRELSYDEQQRLAAQIVWTVRQAHGVGGVRILVNGTPLRLPEAGEVQTTQTWDRFDPAASEGSSQVFALRRGRLVVVNGQAVSEFAGPWGEQRSDLAGFKVDPTLSTIAVVPPGRGSVGISSLSESTEVDVVATGNNFAQPTWDGHGRLFVLDRSRRGTQMSVIDGEKAYGVPLGSLSRMRVTSFELAPDNSRFVAIARKTGRKQRGAKPPQVYLGVLRHDEDGRVTGVADVHVLRLSDEGLTAPLSVAWRSTVGVVVLASLEDGFPQPYVARIDGSTVSGGSLTREPLLGDIGATAVLCSGVLAAPVYVADSKGRLWVQDVNGRWEQVPGAPLRSPSYPG